MSTFLELGVRKDFVKGLKELGIKNPTERKSKFVGNLLDH